MGDASWVGLWVVTGHRVGVPSSGACLPDGFLFFEFFLGAILKTHSELENFCSLMILCSAEIRHVTTTIRFAHVGHPLVIRLVR